MSDQPVLSHPVTRRRFLVGGSLAGFAAFLAACTGSPTESPSQSATPGVPTAPPVNQTPTPAVPTEPPVPTGPLHFANWEAYIDLAGAAYDEGVYSPGSSPTIEQFKEKYGVEVDYVEKIGDNEDFYAIIQPALATDLPTGWDLVVLTDWMAARLISKGWIEPIDQGNVPNCVNNLRDGLKNQPWDANNDYHYPWQSGMTGIGYNANSLKKAGKAAPTSIADLYALPANRINFLTEARDTWGLGLLKLGKAADPATTTADDLQAVYDDLAPLVANGARFLDNSYLQDFASKKVWAGMVWSGDLASSGTPGDTFVFPAEGCMVWTDNLMIPKGAENKYTAELMMNFVYDPQIAAQIENYVYYVCPVNGAAEIMQELNAEEPLDQYYLDLIFPGPELVAQMHNFQFLSDELETRLKELYLDLKGV